MRYFRPVKLMRTFVAVKDELPRVLPLFRDPAVPTWAKLLAVLAALFVVSPLNFLSDIPVLGFFDDAALLALIIHRFVNYAESHKAQYASAGTGSVARY